MDHDSAVNSAQSAGNPGSDAQREWDVQPDFPGFDLAWARSSPTHELSAHGRRVQRRLDAPPPQQPRPSTWKRLRFALYRLRAGR